MRITSAFRTGMLLGPTLGWWCAMSASAGGAGFAERVIVRGAALAQDVFVADLDGDGDLDVVSASLGDDTIAWYENTPGASWPQFTEHIITTTADRAKSVHVADLDGDGDLDVLSAATGQTGGGNASLAWHQNDGGFPPLFTTHVIALGLPELRGSSCVFAADLDGDGRQDVLVAEPIGDDPDFPPHARISWRRNEGGAPPQFTRFDVSVGVGLAGVETLFAADIDGDGDIDVVSGAFHTDTVRWHENDGQSPPQFTDHEVSTGADGVLGVHAADFDGDGDLDIVSASRYDDTIAWYENDGQSPPQFTTHVISSTFNRAWDVRTADVDQDGDPDVLAVSYTEDKISWFENDGAVPPQFVERVITTSADSVSGVYSGDLDQDGDVDIVGAISSEAKISWYEQGGRPLEPCADLPAHGNGVVNGSDLAYLLGFWGSAHPQADLNGDGLVDGADLARLLGQWGPCGELP